MRLRDHISEGVIINVSSIAIWVAIAFFMITKWSEKNEQDKKGMEEYHHCINKAQSLVDVEKCRLNWEYLRVINQ